MNTLKPLSKESLAVQWDRLQRVIEVEFVGDEVCDRDEVLGIPVASALATAAWMRLLMPSMSPLLTWLLGMESRSSFGRAPEGNGCIERFWRTLNEQLLWVHTFASVDDLNQALREFQDHYSQNWLIGRHGHRAPGAVR